MFGHHKKIWKRKCLSGLVLCLLAVCVGIGCSTIRLRKEPDTDKIWTCYNAADEAIKLMDYKTGILLHERFLEKGPKNALALYHLGYAYGRMGDHLKEVYYYEEAIALEFTQNRIFYNLGMAYVELNNIDKSIDAFINALEMDPDNADNHFGLAMAYCQKGIADKLSEEEFLKAIRIDPKHIDARLYLSILYVDMGEFPKAAEQLRKIIEIDPGNIRARKLLDRIKRE